MSVHPSTSALVPVHWLVQTDVHVPRNDSFLAQLELTRAEALRVPKRVAEFRLGRWTAKRALSTLKPGRPLWAWELRAAPDGAPVVMLDDAAGPLVVSLSHTAGCAFCTVAPSGVVLGCDIEHVEPHSPAFLEDYFTERERERLLAEPEPFRSLHLTMAWSAKESALKATREGLRRDTRQVEVDWEGEGQRWSRLTVRVAGEGEFHGFWWFRGEVVLTMVAHPQPDLPRAIVPDIDW